MRYIQLVSTEDCSSLNCHMQGVLVPIALINAIGQLRIASVVPRQTSRCSVYSLIYVVFSLFVASDIISISCLFGFCSKALLGF